MSARRSIRLLGSVYGCVLLLYLLSSPFVAAILPLEVPRRAEGWGVWLASLSVVPDAIAAAARGDGPLSDTGLLIGTYGVLLSATTCLWVAGFATLCRYRKALDDSHADSIFRWSCAFCVVLIPAVPIVTHDLWMSAVWGRLVADGLNPYYVDPPVASDLPFWQVSPGHTTYGPLWTLLSGVVAFLMRGNAIAIAAVHKILIAAAWIAGMRVVRALTRGSTAFAQCSALMLMGWAPLALLTGIGDGHNDPLMVLPMLLWLFWLERGQTVSAAVALGLAASVKYTAGPLIILQGLHGVVTRRREGSRVVVSLAVTGFIVALCMAFFFRSLRFFDAAREMRAWSFNTPASTVVMVAKWLGFTSPLLSPIVNFVTAAIAFGAAGAWLRTRSAEGFRTAVLWLLTGVTLSLLGHVWPWFILWLLPLAAIQPARRISWFIYGLALAAPFTAVQWSGTTGSNMLVEFVEHGPLLFLVGMTFVLASTAVRRRFHY